MIDLDAPLKNRVLLEDANIDKNKFYYVAFVYKNKIETRPIKITDIFRIYSSNGSGYLRTEAYFEYHFETEKTKLKKVFDARFWRKLFGKYELVPTKITERWKIDFDKEWDSLNFELIGESSDIAKLKLIMSALKSPYPDKNELFVIEQELDYFKEYHPELVMKAMDWEMPSQFGGILNCSDRFINIKGDLRNGV